MSGERFPSVGGQEIEGQVTFDDLEAENENSQNLANGETENSEESEEKSPRELAIEKIQNAEEIDNLRELAPELKAQFGDTDKELDAIFKKRIEAIRVRNRVVTSIPFYKKHEKLVERYNLTKDNPDFTEDDKIQIYKAIKRKLEAEGWTGQQKGDALATESEGNNEAGTVLKSNNNGVDDVKSENVEDQNNPAATGEIDGDNMEVRSDYDEQLKKVYEEFEKIHDEFEKELEALQRRFNQELGELEKRINALFSEDSGAVDAGDDKNSVTTEGVPQGGFAERIGLARNDKELYDIAKEIDGAGQSGNKEFDSLFERRRQVLTGRALRLRRIAETNSLSGLDKEEKQLEEEKSNKEWFNDDDLKMIQEAISLRRGQIGHDSRIVAGFHKAGDIGDVTMSGGDILADVKNEGNPIVNKNVNVVDNGGSVKQEAAPVSGGLSPKEALDKIDEMLKKGEKIDFDINEIAEQFKTEELIKDGILERLLERGADVERIVARLDKQKIAENFALFSRYGAKLDVDEFAQEKKGPNPGELSDEQLEALMKIAVNIVNPAIDPSGEKIIAGRAHEFVNLMETNKKSQEPADITAENMDTEEDNPKLGENGLDGIMDKEAEAYAKTKQGFVGSFDLYLAPKKNGGKGYSLKKMVREFDLSRLQGVSQSTIEQAFQSYEYGKRGGGVKEIVNHKGELVPQMRGSTGFSNNNSGMEEFRRLLEARYEELGLDDMGRLKLKKEGIENKDVSESEKVERSRIKGLFAKYKIFNKLKR